jgi:hypothetical protein
VRIDVKVDTSLLDKNVKRYTKNLAFSTAQALNDTVLEAQRRIREHMRVAFHLRKTDFMNRAIKIFVFAKVQANRPYAEIGVDNRPRLLLSMFEQGGQRLPWVGRNVAIPITGAARPSSAAAVRTDLTFAALNFKKAGVNAAGRKALAARRAKGIRKRKLGGQYYYWQGNQRTFILTSTRAAPLGGVFQRTGPKRDDIRMIYSFRSSVRIQAALNFVATTEQAFGQVFQEAFYRRFYRLTA